jgi:hypothetical protein
MVTLHLLCIKLLIGYFPECSVIVVWEQVILIDGVSKGFRFGGKCINHMMVLDVTGT